MSEVQTITPEEFTAQCLFDAAVALSNLRDHTCKFINYPNECESYNRLDPLRSDAIEKKLRLLVESTRIKVTTNGRYGQIRLWWD
jgi:hypothetical protein